MIAKLQTWTRANPLMALALVAVGGILIAEQGWVRANSPAFVLGAAAWLGVALICGRAWPLFPGLAMVFAFIHATRTDETFRHPLRLALQTTDEPVQATIRGSLLPDFDATADGRAHALCTTQKIEIPVLGLVVEQTTTLLARLPKNARFPGAGVYELHGSIRLPRASSNPGTFDAQEYALRIGRVARLDVEGMRRVGDNHEALWCALLEAAERCRQWIGRKLTQDLEEDPETAAVIRAMALGVSTEAADEIEDAFRDSGTLHVFAVSGLHVALLGVIAMALLRQIGLRRGLSLWLLVGVVFAYAFITGWRPSAARAAMMVAVFVAAPVMDRESSLQNSLGGAALLLLGADTHQVFMPGFQLSFVVLWLSVIGSVPLLERLMPFTRLDPFLPPQLASFRQRASSQLRHWFAANVSVSTAAWLGSLPFILGHFQSVTPVAVIANCVLVPLSFLCLGATCLSLCASVLHLSGVQIILNNANWALAKAMIASAAWFAGLPGANFHFQPNASPKDAAAVWRVLELPHGAAANHLRVPDEHWLLDAGDETSFRRVLLPYLRSCGVNSISGVFLSHNDSDHVGAVQKVIENFDSPLLFTSTQEPGSLDSSLSTLRRLADSPHAALMRRLRVEEQWVVSDDPAFKITAQLLHPSQEIQNARGDDRAMILMMHLGTWRVLWMSDAGWLAEKILLNSAADLRCDVLIRSQHEHDLSPTTEFLLRTQPRVILCGSDARQVETRLPGSLLQHAKAWDIPLLDTWVNGSVEMRFQKHELRITPSHGAPPVILMAR